MKKRRFDASAVIPDMELNACSYLRRNHDIALGTATDLFFCMNYIGHYVCTKEFHIKRKMSDTALLLLTISGEGRLLYRGNQYSLTQGTCMLIDPRRFHEYCSVGDRWEFKYLHFDGALTDQYLSYIEDHAGTVFSLSKDEFFQMERTLNHILDLTAGNEVHDYPGISGLIYNLLVLLLTHSREGSDIGSVGIKTISGAVAYIRKNYKEDIRTDDIARAVNLSRSYMSELFTHTFGISPHEYVVQFRLSIAKNLLMNSSFSITEIAEQTGFRDVSSFSRAFKRQIGISPIKYRATYNVEK